MDSAGGAFYASARHWLDDAARLFAGRIELILAAHSGGADGESLFAGYVASDEAMRLARTIQDGAEARPNDPPELALIAARLSDARAVQALPVGRLMTAFSLPPDHLPLLALLAVGAIDVRFATLFAWLNDDAQRRGLTPALAERLCGPWSAAASENFAADAALCAYQIVAMADEPARVLADRTFGLQDPVARWLCGDPGQAPVDPALEGLLSDVPFADMAALLPDGGLAMPQPGAGLLVMTGLTGCGRAAIMAAHWAAAGIGAWQMDARDVAVSKPVLAAALRNAVLTGRGLILSEANGLPAATLRWLTGMNAAPLALTASDRIPLEVPHIAVPALDPVRTRGLWRHTLGPARAESADRLAHQFRLPVADMLRIADSPAGDHPALVQACLDRSAGTLAQLATHIEPRHDWRDLILPACQMAKLEEIVTRARHARQVFDDWGFGRKLVPHRGLSALFSGPSGAGKTLSASVIARALGLPLYRVDLSATVSKYIGETEKNLEQVFSAAEAGNACLLFDECDALFGKRSEVSDAHDRYANIETSYLLQRMESHRGVVMMSSNHPQNIDDAFTRRIDVIVEFTLPDAALRQALWRQLMPAEAGAEVDCALLGDGFELSGGSIRNCLVTAAFLAAEARVRIGTDHCIQAVAMEYEKISKPLTRAEFGDAYAALRSRGGG